MISRRRLLQLLTLPYCRTVRVIMPKRIGNLSLELFFVLCVSSLPFAPCAIGAENNHLLVQRVTGVPDDLLNSIENGNFYLNQLLNITVNINSATEILVGTLGAYYSIPRSIIDIIQPGPLPYELFLPTLSEALDGFVGGGGDGEQEAPIVRRQADELDIQGSIQSIATNYVMWLVPVLVVTVLSLILAACFPTFGCFFCCCRLCGKCGGKAYHYKTRHQTAKCVVLSIITLLTSVFLLVGVTLGFLSNAKISSVLKTYTSAVDAAIQDGTNYIDNTLDEVSFIATDQLDNVVDSVINDIEDVATVLGNSLEAALEREASPFLDGINALLDDVDTLQDGFQSVNTALNSLSTVASQLNSSVSELQEALNNLSSMCMGDPSCLSLVPPVQEIELEFNNNEVNVSDALSTLDSVDTDGVRALVDNITQLFSNISGRIDEQLGDFELPINRSQFEIVSSTIESVRGTVDGVIGGNGTLSEIRGIIRNEGDFYIGLFDMYRYILAVVMFVAILLIGTVFLFGLFCGAFGYSSKALPYERSQVSTCGARLLLFGVALTFLFGGLLLILASFMYFGSTVQQKICNDLAPPEYTAFQRVFDDRQVWNGRTLVGSILHSQLGIDSNISVTTVFRECDGNSPLYEALQVESFFDLNQLLSDFNLTNIGDQLDLEDIDFGSALNFTSADFIPQSRRQDLEDLQANVMNNANLTAYIEYLNDDRLSFDIQVVSDNLTALATHFSDNMLESMANYTIDVRDNLLGTTINRTLQEFNEIRSFLVGNLTGLSSVLQGIGVQVNSTFDNLEQFLNQTGAVVNNEVEAYVDRILGAITGFIDFALDVIKNEIGRCKPITAAYTGLHIAFCTETLDGVNGFWFSIGWCAIFLIPMLISGAILTNYIRRSPTDVHPVTDDDDIGYVDTVISNPRISAGYNGPITRLPNTPHA